MKLSTSACVAIAFAATVAVSCAGVPGKRIDTILRGAVAEDLGSPLAEVSIAAGPSDDDIEGVVRELFPVAAACAGIASAEKESRAEYAMWLREEEYTSGIDTYTAILCVLKLRSKFDGSILAKTIVADETKLSLRSSGYLYALIREALRSLAGPVIASEKAEKAAAK
jgi:hypothetical protein